MVGEMSWEGKKNLVYELIVIEEIKIVFRVWELFNFRW